MCHDIDTRWNHQGKGHCTVCKHTQNRFPGQNSSLTCLMLDNISHMGRPWPKSVHVRYPSSYPKGQSHWAYIPPNGSWAFTPHCHDNIPVPEMRIWSIMSIKSDLKWCKHQVEVSFHISITCWVSLLVDQGVPEDTCSQVLWSSSVDS